jgi:hypothetical protein
VAYDEGLATRVRELIGDQPGLVEKEMFGGLAMLLDGNMAVGVHGDSLIVRTDPARQPELLARPGARVFDMTGRPMKAGCWSTRTASPKPRTCGAGSTSASATPAACHLNEALGSAGDGNSQVPEGTCESTATP